LDQQASELQQREMNVVLYNEAWYVDVRKPRTERQQIFPARRVLRETYKKMCQDGHDHLVEPFRTVEEWEYFFLADGLMLQAPIFLGDVDQFNKQAIAFRKKMMCPRFNPECLNWFRKPKNEDNPFHPDYKPPLG
jgi:hypothetical protein